MFEQILVVTSVTFLCMISPGPDMIIVLRNALAGGRRAGLITSAGVLSGNLIHISYCLLGIGWVISQSIVAFNLLKFAGAAYLIYLGVESLLAGREVLSPDIVDRPEPVRGFYLQGLLNNVLNPKGTLFYMGVFTLLIEAETSAVHMAVLVLTMMTVSAIFWLAFVCTLDRPSVKRVFEHGQQTVNRILGVLLISIGLKVAVTER